MGKTLAGDQEEGAIIALRQLPSRMARQVRRSFSCDCPGHVPIGPVRRPLEGSPSLCYLYVLGLAYGFLRTVAKKRSYV